MIRHLCLLGLAIEMLMGCAMSPALSAPAQPWVQEVGSEPTPQFANLWYRLGTSDVLEITLYERPALRREVTISGRGTFVYPLIGQVWARGLTVEQLETKLTLYVQRCTRIPTPHVVVTVKAYHNRHIMLLGQVQVPGVYALPEQARLRELIEQAQGLTPEADDYLIIIHGERQAWLGSMVPATHMRDAPGTRVDLKKLMTGQVTPTVTLRSGDTIYVPRRLTAYASYEFKGAAAAWYDPSDAAIQTH